VAGTRLTYGRKTRRGPARRGGVRGRGNSLTAAELTPPKNVGRSNSVKRWRSGLQRQRIHARWRRLPMSLMQVISPFPFPLSPFPFPLSPSLVSRAPWTPLGQAQWECRNGVQECNVPGKCTLMPQPFSRCAAPSLTELPVAISQQCATEKQSWSASIAKRTANRGVRSPRSQSKAMLPQCPSCTGRLVSPPRPQPHRLWSPKRHSQVQDLSTLNPKP